MKLLTWAKKNRKKKFEVLSPIFGAVPFLTGEDIENLIKFDPDWNFDVFEASEKKDGLFKTKTGLYTERGEHILEQIN